MSDLPDAARAILPFPWPMDETSNKFQVLLSIVTAGEEFVPYLKEALRAGADPFEFQGGDWSSALLAAAHGKLECLKAIVEFSGIEAVATHQGPSMHAANVFYAAINYGRVNIVQYLIEQGVSVNGDSEHRLSPLEWALHKGMSEMVDLLIRSGADVAKREQERGHSILSGLDSVALVFGDGILRLVLGAGANPDGQTSSGKTLLTQAVDNCNRDRILLLLKAGADPNLESVADFPPLHFAVRLPVVADEIIKILLEHGANPDGSPNNPGHLLCRTALEKNDQYLEILIAAGASVDLYNQSFNDTPLGVAAIFNSIACAKVLLEAGADINGDARSPNSPLCSAITRGHVDMVTWLLEKGADVNRANIIGATPLALALERLSDDRIVDALLKAGADPFAKNRHNVSPYDRLTQLWHANPNDSLILRCLGLFDARKNRPASDRPEPPRP